MRSRPVKGTDHCVYATIGEFRETYPTETLYNWRDSDVGDWVISDDLQVAQVIAEGHLGPKVQWVRTAIGQFNRKWHTMEGWASNIYHFNAGKKSIMREKDIMTVKYFVDTGGDKKRAWLMAHPDSVAKDVYVKMMSNKFFNHKIVQDCIVEEARSRIKDFLSPEKYAEIMEIAGMKAAEKGDLDKLLPFMAFWSNVAEGVQVPILTSGEQPPANNMQIASSYAKLGKHSEEQSDG